MRSFLPRAVACALVLLAFATPALAQILPAEAGRKGCWRRVYDAAHLASHPRQSVAEMTFFLRVKAYDAKGNEVARNPDHLFYNFALGVKRRGEAKARVTSGDCSGEAAMQCVVDCDGGGAMIERAPKCDGLVLKLEGEGIAFGNDCDTFRGTFLAPGADDKIFLLEAQPIAACTALERNGLGE
jgi:hypothetical protein